MFDEHGHIQITPRDFARRAFDDPNSLINHALLPGTPMGFSTYPQYMQFVDYLTESTGIHPHHFLFRGSTKIGFSISPNTDERKTWRQFGAHSDLDLAISDPHFYATLDEQVRRHDRLPSNQVQIFRFYNTIEFDKYQRRIDQKGRHDCYRYFDLPGQLPCMQDLQRVLKEAPIADCCHFPFRGFKAFIFRDRWAVHRRYLTDLDDLRRGLTARRNPLPPAPDVPFPVEA